MFEEDWNGFTNSQISESGKDSYWLSKQFLLLKIQILLINVKNWTDFNFFQASILEKPVCSYISFRAMIFLLPDALEDWHLFKIFFANPGQKERNSTLNYNTNLSLKYSDK